MNKLYTKIYSKGNLIIEKYIDEEGNRHIDEIPYEPYIFLERQLSQAIKTLDFKEFKSNKTIYGNKLHSIKEFYDLKRELKDQEKIYFDIPLHEQYRIFNYYNKELVTDKKGMVILNYDIETRMSSDVDIANGNQPVLMITFQDLLTKKIITYGLKDSNVPNYIKLQSEEQLIYKYFETIKNADIITGWYTKYFDDVFMINRGLKVLGEDFLDHFGLKVTKMFNKEKKKNYFKFRDICSLDYIEVYQVLTRSNLPSYSLNAISKLELKDEKLEYKSDYSNLDNLYDNNFDKYILYNQKDVELVGRIEDKKDLFSVVVNLAYLYRSDFEDSISTVKNWENFIACELLKTKRIPSYNVVDANDTVNYKGGHIDILKDQTVQEWVVGFDIASSYPNQMIGFNISPEKILNYSQLPDELKSISEKYNSEDKILNNIEKYKESVLPILKKYNVILTPAGHFFKKDTLGLFPAKTKTMFEDRYKFKKEKQKYESALKKDPKNESILKLHNEFKNKDKAWKSGLVSEYGALANKYFNYFDVRLAESITAGGRLCIKGISQHLRSLGYEILFNHTDSMYVNMKPFVTKTKPSEIIKEIIQKSEELKRIIEKFFTDLSVTLNQTEKRITMEMEFIANKILFVSKTHRIANKVWKNGQTLENPELEFTGIQIVKSSTSDFVKEYMLKLLELIFNNTSNDEINIFLENTKKKFWSADLEYIASRSGISDIDKRSLGDKGIPIYILGSLIYNKIVETKKLKLPKITNSSKIKYIYTLKNNYVNSHCVATLDKFTPELMEGIKVDYETQWQKTFMENAKELLEINKNLITLDAPPALF